MGGLACRSDEAQSNLVPSGLESISNDLLARRWGVWKRYLTEWHPIRGSVNIQNDRRCQWAGIPLGMNSSNVSLE